jgi:hypothetical protein
MLIITIRVDPYIAQLTHFPALDDKVNALAGPRVFFAPQTKFWAKADRVFPGALMIFWRLHLLPGALVVCAGSGFVLAAFFAASVQATLTFIAHHPILKP